MSELLQRVSPGSASLGDDFSSALWKLRTLFNLKLSDRVLLVGATLPESVGTEEAGFASDRCADAKAARNLSSEYRLIIWGAPFDRFEEEVDIVLKALAPQGLLLLFAPSRMSVFRGRHSLRAALSGSLQTPKGYQRRLAKAGARVEMCWLPWPTLEGAEEYVAVEEMCEILASTGIRAQLSARMRVAWHDGHVLLATRESSVPAICESLAQSVGDFLGLREPPRVTRFDLRQRGALVLMLQGGQSSQKWVARVSHHSKVSAHLAANERIVSQLRNSAANAEGVLRLLPRPLGNFRVDGVDVWLEERLPGTVVWRLPRRVRVGIDREWMRFLRDLHAVGSAQTDLDDRAAGDVVRRWRSGTRGLPEELDSEVSRLEAWLEIALTNSRRTLGWCHGDFGYGNLLAHPQSGVLQAVIDWETGRADEIAGIDWMNMVLVGERMKSGLALAVVEVARRMRCLDDTDESARGLALILEATGPSGSADEILGLALLRIIQREARYPTLMAGSALEFTAALRAFRTVVGY